MTTLIKVMICLMGIGWVFFPPLAVAQKTINLLTWEGYAPDAYIAEFEKNVKEKYGTTVKIKRTYVNDTTEIFIPVRMGQADIFVPTQHVLNDGRWKFIENKLALPLNLENIPNFRNLLASLKPYTTFSGKVYAVPIAHGAYGLAYNTRFFKEPPKTWNILWDEKYKGKFAITKGTTELNIYLTALVLGYDWADCASYATLNNDQFKNKLRTLVQNAHSFWPGIDSPHHLKGLHLATSWGWALSGLKEIGEEWRMIDPEEGSPAWIDSHAISHSLKNKPFLKKIAEEWINYTLGKRYQVEVVVNYLSSAPVTQDIVAQLPKDKIKAFHLDDPEYFTKYRHVYPSIDNKRDRNGLKILWNDACKGIDLKEREQE